MIFIKKELIFIFISECQFGKGIKELGSTWYADLGPPFGVMYCIKCECVPVCIFTKNIYGPQWENIALVMVGYENEKMNEKKI